MNYHIRPALDQQNLDVTCAYVLKPKLPFLGDLFLTSTFLCWGWLPKTRLERIIYIYIIYIYIDAALPLNSSLLNGKQCSWSSLQTAFWGLDICRYFRQVSQMILSCHFMFRNRWRTSLEVFCYLAVPASDKVRVISVISEKEIPLPAFIKVKEPLINPLWSIWLTNSWCFDHIYFSWRCWDDSMIVYRSEQNLCCFWRR